ncbi:MAG: NADH-quinone oxidoreductase subunit NuoN [Thiolinea sp.]
MEFGYAAPEVFLLVALCTVLVLDIFLGEESPLITYLAAQLSLWTTVLLVYSNSFSRTYFAAIERMYMVDQLGGVIKIAILLLASMTMIYARKYLRDQNAWRGEFFVLIMVAVLGMMVMASGHNLLILYLGLELLALSLYALVALQRDSAQAAEAAMKYFVLGAVASGLLLYGMSLIYGLTGSLELGVIRDYLDAAQLQEGGQVLPNQDIVWLFALSFIVAGLAFKLGMVPFHMWLPDVYQGAPTVVALFLGSAPKLAILVLVIRLLQEGLGVLQPSWSQLLLVLGLLSVVAGNLIALAQTSLKRMFAYSAIAHMGFMVLALASEVEGNNHFSTAMFYVLVYALAAIGGFAILVLLGRRGYDPDALDSLSGLNARHPWYALMMLLILFSMAGVPPTAGFYAKLAVLKVVFNAGHVWPVVIMVVMSVVGAFYYLRAIKLMYFDEPQDQAVLRVDADFGVLFSLNGLVIIVLGLFPGLLMGVCMDAIKASGL